MLFSGISLHPWMWKSLVKWMGRKNVLLAWHEQLDWSCNWFLSKFKHQYKRAQNFKRWIWALLIIEATYGDKNFLLINLYNANNEKDQIEVLDTLCKLLENHDTDGDCHTILSGDFNIIFDTILDTSGGNASLKKKTIAKIISIAEMLDTCDAFRIRYPILQRFSFRRKNPSLL